MRAKLVDELVVGRAGLTELIDKYQELGYYVDVKAFRRESMIEGSTIKYRVSISKIEIIKEQEDEVDNINQRRQKANLFKCSDH